MIRRGVSVIALAALAACKGKSSSESAPTPTPAPAPATVATADASAPIATVDAAPPALPAKFACYERALLGDDTHGSELGQLAVLPDGGAIVAAAVDGADPRSSAVLVTRIDAAGNRSWTTSVPGGSVMGAVAADDIVLGGVTADARDGWLVRVSLDGKPELSTPLAGWGEMDELVGAANGDVFAVTHDRFDTGDKIARVARIARDGKTAWNKTYGEHPGTSRLVAGVAEGAGAVLGGTTQNHAWLLRVDGDGGVVWDKRLGDETMITAIARRADGPGWIVAGRRDSKGWIAIVDDKGTLVSDHVFARGATSELESVASLPGGGIAALGDTQDGEDQRSNLWLLTTSAAWKKQLDRVYKGGATEVAGTIAVVPDGFLIHSLVNPHNQNTSVGEVFVRSTDPKGDTACALP